MQTWRDHMPNRDNLIKGITSRWIIIVAVIIFLVIRWDSLEAGRLLFIGFLGLSIIQNSFQHYLATRKKLNHKLFIILFSFPLSIAFIFDLLIVFVIVSVTGGISSELFYLLLLRIVYSASNFPSNTVLWQAIAITCGYLLTLIVTDFYSIQSSVPILLLRFGLLWVSFFLVSFMNRERNENLEKTRDLDTRLNIMLELSRKINNTHDLQSIVDFATQSAFSLVRGSSSSTVLTLTPDGERLIVKSATGLTLLEQDTLFSEGFPVSKGIVGTVIKTGEPLIVEDTRTRPEYFAVRDDIRSELTVPIKREGKVIGVFNLESIEDAAFSRDDLGYMETLSDIVAVAINNAELYRQLESKLKTLSAMLEVSNTMISAIGEDVLEFINQKAKELLDCDHSTIFMLDEDGYIKAKVSSSEDKEAILQMRLRPGVGITGSVIISGVPRLIQDSSKDNNTIIVPGTEPDPETMICVPLKLRGKVKGAITVNRTGTLHMFTQEDVEILELFANLAASAIESSEAFRSEKERRAAMESAVDLRNAIMDNISNTLKTPLVIVLSYLNILRTEPDISQEETRQYLMKMEAQAQRLDLTLDRILFASRLATHKIEVNPGQVFLHMLLLEVLSGYQKVIEDKRISVQLECPNRAIGVLQDEDLLRKLLQDFIDNAVNFNSDDGTLLITCLEKEGDIVLTIADTGPGLPPGFRESLLVALSSQDDNKGAGLGLYSSMMIAELLGIPVDFDSHAGLGTTITLTIKPLKNS